MTTDQIFNEQDPNGLNQHEPGAKLDSGKQLAGLVIGDFALALQEVVKVGTFGATKYNRSGWMSVTEAESRYTDAMMRHFLAEQSGEEIDQESQCLHAAQVAWNALARLHFIIKRMQFSVKQIKETECKNFTPSDVEKLLNAFSNAE